MEETDYTYGTDNEQLETPSFDDLVNVGFDEETATDILENHPSDAQRLYNVMTEANEAEEHANEAMNEDQSYFSQSAEETSTDSSETNGGQQATMSDQKYSTADCSRTCEVNTGHSYQYSDYGYSL